MAQPETCLKCLTMLAAAKSHTITESLQAAYLAALEDLSDDEIKTATVEALKTLAFFPSPAELRELARPSRALLAWEAFRSMAVRKDGRQSIEPQDPAMSHTIRSLGGWSRACYMPIDELCGYYRTEWIKTYREYERMGKRAPLDNFRLLGATLEPVVKIECSYMQDRELARIA